MCNQLCTVNIACYPTMFNSQSHDHHMTYVLHELRRVLKHATHIAQHTYTQFLILDKYITLHVLNKASDKTWSTMLEGFCCRGKDGLRAMENVNKNGLFSFHQLSPFVTDVCHYILCSTCVYVCVGVGVGVCGGGGKAIDIL